MSWRHVPTLDNTADILSRSLSPIDLIKHETWQRGPVWLKIDASEWPRNIVDSVSILELRPTHLIHFATQKVELITKYSSIVKLKRMTALILHFKYNAFNKGNRRIGRLTFKKLNDASLTILKITQSEAFSSDTKKLAQTKSVTASSQLRALNPFLDEQGLIRVGGRLKNSVLPYSEKYPIDLPKGHHATELIIKDSHEVNLHGGTQATLHAVRSKYW